MPLEDVLKHVKTEAEARVGKPIPIYVDPTGLQSARQTMKSTVRLDLEGAALKNSLRRCLKQLDLSYVVRDGFLMITESGAPLPVYEDPFLIVGHCLIALIAAGLGGVFALLVSDARTRTSVDQGGSARPLKLVYFRGVAGPQRTQAGHSLSIVTLRNSR